MEYRCPSTLHGTVDEETNTIEVKCRSNKCGAGKGVVVLHYFNRTTGYLVHTKRYRDPVVVKSPAQGKEERNATHSDAAAVRSA